MGGDLGRIKVCQIPAYSQVVKLEVGELTWEGEQTKFVTAETERWRRTLTGKGAWLFFPFHLFLLVGG